MEISNNRAKRSIKPFVMGRKNFLFANTPSGARTGAVIYSLIVTAKENGKRTGSPSLSDLAHDHRPNATPDGPSPGC